MPVAPRDALPISREENTAPSSRQAYSAEKVTLGDAEIQAADPGSDQQLSHRRRWQARENDHSAERHQRV